MPLPFWFLYWVLSSQISMAAVVLSPYNPSTMQQFEIVPRSKYILNNSTGTLQVFNPSTNQPVPQGPATDGSGTNFSPPAVIWLGFCFLFGIPIALAGIRGWRLTTGVAIGLASTVCSWAAFINSVNNVGVSDILLTAIILGFFFLGFIFGLFEIGRVVGLALLGVIGGFAFGVRIILMRKDLLFPGDSLFAVNWLLIALLGLLNGLAMILSSSRRAGILFGSASVGTFLSFLGVDLIVNKQSGFSRGLRFLFDRNASHLAASWHTSLPDIISNGYNPSLSTKILLAVSLGLTPILAHAQHRIFKQPFSRRLRLDPVDEAEPPFTLSRMENEPINEHVLVTHGWHKVDG